MYCKDRLKAAAKLGPATLQQKRKEELLGAEAEREKRERIHKRKLAEERINKDNLEAIRLGEEQAERERTERERTDRARNDRERNDRELEYALAAALANPEGALADQGCAGRTRADRDHVDLTQREHTSRSQLQLPPQPPPPPPPPLPPSVQPVWHEVRAANGQIYFWNTITREVSWNRPSSLATALVTREEPRQSHSYGGSSSHGSRSETSTALRPVG